MEYEIKKIRRIVSSRIDMYAAKVVFRNGLSLDITYDRLEGRLIIHKWYKLEETVHHKLRHDLEGYFLKQAS